MMYSIEVDFPVAPAGTIMPEPLQTIVLFVSIAALAAVFVVAIRMTNKYRTAIPVLMIVAGICSCGLEPIAAFLGHALHAEIGQIVAFKALDRLIPWHMLAIYGAYLSAFYLSLFSRMRENRLPKDYLWKVYFIMLVIAYFFEIIPVSCGLWIYYDYQPLWIWKGTLPVTWAFINTVCVIVPALLIYKMMPLMTGWKQIMVVPLSAIGVFMGHLGAGFPFYFAVNTNLGPVAMEFVGILTVFTALFVAWIFIHLMSSPEQSE